MQGVLDVHSPVFHTISTRVVQTLTECFDNSLFRVVGGDLYVQNFASDRSHMASGIINLDKDNMWSRI